MIDVGSYVLVQVKNIWEEDTKQIDSNCFFIVRINSQKYAIRPSAIGPIGNDYFAEVIWFYDVEYNELHFKASEIIHDFGSVEPSEKEMDNFQDIYPEYWI